MKFTLEMSDIELRATIRAPQYGRPKIKVREVRVNKKKITPGQLEELAKLLKEAK